MGLSELSWSEIVQWANQFYSTPVMVYVPAGDDQFIPTPTKECSLSTWELLTIRELSAAYAAEYSQASDKNRPAPYTPVSEDEIDRVALANKFRNILRSFKKNPQEPRYEVEE